MDAMKPIDMNFDGVLTGGFVFTERTIKGLFTGVGHYVPGQPLFPRRRGQELLSTYTTTLVSIHIGQH